MIKINDPPNQLEETMKEFMDQDFLLETEVAKWLYHDIAKHMPIYDYHNHLSAKEIYENNKYENITQVWLGADHYKWRLLRSNGYTEEYATGNKDDYSKFLAFAKTIPYAIGNPMYHWTHLELQRFFDINEPLSEKTAPEIYAKCNEKLKQPDFTVQKLIERSNVVSMCTTDDPKDNLEYHKLLQQEKFSCNVLPRFRPDNLIHIEKLFFAAYIEDVQKLGYKLDSIKDVEKFLTDRIDYFHEVGCRLSDHGLDRIMYQEATPKEVEAIFHKALAKEKLTFDELSKYKGYVLSFLGKEYNKRNWVMQLHIGPMRNNSERMLKQCGVDAGFDSINDKDVAEACSRLLDSMDRTNELPRTILYCLNPADNAVLASMLGNFQGGGIAGKMQFGSGWWFQDTKSGMINQMRELANMGLLSRFVGMLTDSRSFLSFPRHEYFRRIMCNEIGNLVENGEYPYDKEILREIIEGICFNNINNYIQK